MSALPVTSMSPKKRGRPPKGTPPKAKDPLKKELFQVKKDFLWRNYEGFNKWSIGLRIMNTLFELIPDIGFWKTFTLIKPFPIFWLQKSEGKTFLLKEYDKWKNNQREIPLAIAPERFIIKDKIGPDIAAPPKIKTLKDFPHEETQKD